MQDPSLICFLSMIFRDLFPSTVHKQAEILKAERKAIVSDNASIVNRTMVEFQE